LAIAAEDLRIHVYDHLLQRGVPPRAAEIARHFATDEASAKEALRSLRIGKTILVHPINGEIWMAGPFAAAPTAYRVTSGSTEWFANCAWDMLGVAVIVEHTVRVHTRCADCDEPIDIIVDPETGPNVEGFVHFLVPASRWYDDIGFT
jgi:hypothetical protein